ncbi:hypothetical protein [Sphingomonas sp.]|uniref:hypothetical protein n=1 Tax=Sphingomonas sp. TaxID=28214 RepID=UPI002ED9947D
MKADDRRREAKDWNRWMESAAKLADRFYLEAGNDDPFMYGEQASVGFLATAAAHAGFMALPEFAVTKNDIKNSSPRSGRSDLWISSSDREWWFEAKQRFINRGSKADLVRSWRDAERCASEVRDNGTAVAMLIVSCWRLKGPDAPAKGDTGRPIKVTRQAAREAVHDFKNERQFAWRLGRDDDRTPETYIFFDILKG